MSEQLKSALSGVLKGRAVIAVAAIVSTMLVNTGYGQVVISEFMAKNDETLVDGDGAYSDWIELYNMGSSAVALTGWYLSDDAAKLTQWTFPAKSIAAGEHLIIFASGQDEENYTDSLGYLHTNFKLSGSGESVVLTKADGTSIAHSFVDYPDQEDDISYGLAQDSSYSYLIAEEEDAKAWVGTSEPSSSWNTASYNDSSWQSGQTGVGFEEVDSTWTGGGRPPRDWEPEAAVYEDLISTELTTMQDRTASAYIRVAFTLDGTEDISQLSMRMKYDDGFVAYVNGTQVSSANAPDSPVYSSSATAEHEGSDYEDFTILNADSFLQTGDNVLAIHGLNLAASDTDFLIYPVLTGIMVGDIQTNAVMYYSAPSPGSDNVSGVLGYVGDTTFSMDRGFYTNAFDVEIACKTEGAAIYYTVDGTTPAIDNGTLYTGALTIDKTTVLRAAAFVTGYQPSDADTQTYLFLDDIIAQRTSVSALDPAFPTSSVNGQSFDYGMDPDVVNSSTYSGQIKAALQEIPSISIVTDPDNLFDSASGIYVNPESDGVAWERETSVELLNPDGTKGFQINGGIRIRGGVSRSTGNPKHSFRLFFRSEYGTSRLNYDLFGDEGADSYKRVDLRTGQNNSWQFMNAQYATWLYDIFSRDTHAEMGQGYTRGEYYHLYLNGMYWGLYQTEERPDANYGESYYGGDDDDYDAVKADGDTGIMYASDGTRDAYNDLWAGVSAGVSSDAAYFALQGMNADGSQNDSYTRLLDVDSVIDYMLAIFYTSNRDSPIGPPNQWSQPRNLNCVYNRENPDGFKFIAHDNEHSLEAQYGVNADRVSTSLASSFSQQDYFTPWWLHLQLMNNEEYQIRFADHVQEHFYNDGVLTTDAAAARMEARRDEIYTAVIGESARWGDSVSSNPYTQASWLTAVNNILNNFIRADRTDVVLGQFETKGWLPVVDAPTFSQHGGSIESGATLSMSGKTTIYYTTDGSDPRAVGGDVAGTEYSSAITLTHSTQVKARVLRYGKWSALTKATFVVDSASPLRVTEIMYNPADTDADAEYIELLNTGSETIGLAGTEFTEGIQFEFSEGDVATLAPGEYAVLVSDYDAFTNRYSNWADINIAGKYHGKFYRTDGTLANGGEDVVLKDGLGNTIQDFEYEDWYEITDGDGYSLTLIDPSAATNTWSDSSAWRASAYAGGTPGASSADFLNPDDLVINEALTHQDDDTPGDWVELYNASTNTLDINGWFVSDDDDNLAKVELSGHSSIAPGGYLVLTEASDFGLAVAGTNGFALSELGDEIYLSSGEGGELTGYRVAESFGAAERDVTFGRYVKSDGTTDFTAQSTPSMGATNAYPLISPVAITELMYHPADSNGFEYVEIYNRTSSDVPLYHASYPVNTWKLEGAVEFTFPEGLVLSPGECVVITETNAAAFTSYYSVDAGVTVLGPYDGQLNNSGEDLQLTRPGDPEVLTGEVPYILAEWVDYDDEAPWPTAADGLGSSLERISTGLYPNDAASWSENASPSPGSSLVADDADNLSDAWEIKYFGSTDAENGGEDDDWDEDGSSNYDEYCAGTDPTDADSSFKISSFEETTSGFVFSWASETGKLYSVWSCPDLTSGEFSPVASSIPATPPLNTYTADVSSVESVFFKIAVGDTTTDTDADGLPDSWEIECFGAIDSDNCRAEDDWDGDGLTNYDEWSAGTNPADVRITSFEATTDSFVISWPSVAGKVYSVWTSTNLISDAFSLVSSSLPATPPLNTYTTDLGTADCVFFRLSLDGEDL